MSTSHIETSIGSTAPATVIAALHNHELMIKTLCPALVSYAFDSGDAERFDVAAAIELAEFRDLPNRWLVGWSFGTDLALMHGNDPSVEGAILLSPPLRFSAPQHLQAWAASGHPVLALVPELDDYLRPDEARERFAAIPQARVVGVDGAKHLWSGSRPCAGCSTRSSGRWRRTCRCRCRPDDWHHTCRC